MFSICCCLRGEDERYETNGSPPCGLGDCFLSLFAAIFRHSRHEEFPLSSPRATSPDPRPEEFRSCDVHPRTNEQRAVHQDTLKQIHSEKFSVMIKPSGYDQAVKLPTTQVIIPSSFYAPENDDEDACPTCLEEFTPENPKITTKCNHSYHLGCIYEWKERSNLCPICRREMEFDEST